MVAKYRAQAAIEYLMTYGWAILILLAVLSILYSFNVFSPQQYMSEECLFQPSLQCKSMELKTDGTFNLVLNNGLGYKISNTEYTVVVLSTDETISKPGQAFVNPNNDIIISANFNDAGKFRVGSLEKVRVMLNYELDNNEYSTTGIVGVRVSPA